MVIVLVQNLMCLALIGMLGNKPKQVLHLKWFFQKIIYTRGPCMWQCVANC